MPAIRLMLIAVLASVAFAVRAEPVTLALAHAAVTTHPAQLGSETEMLQKHRLGAIDMDVSSLNYMIKYEKAFAAVVMPCMFAPGTWAST